VFNRNNLVIVVLLLAWLAYRDVIPVPGVPSSNKIDRVTFVTEVQNEPVPRPIAAALRKLNEQGILATSIDQDAVTGLGERPKQYVIAIDRAKIDGVPCLVVQAADVVVRTLKVTKDTTEEQVLEAAK
jgi:hypothetical protein